MDVQGRRSLKPLEVLTQARPPVETRAGARQDSCMTVCMLLEAPQATTGALDPYGPPSTTLSFPLCVCMYIHICMVQPLVWLVY